MFAVTVFHILIINTFVIAVETLLLRKLSKDKVKWGFIILANLSSIFLAYALTDRTFSAYFNTQWFGLEGKEKIEKKFFVSGVVVFIFLTILIEWLFFHFAQKGNKKWLKSLKFSAIINLITNIPIALFYLVNNLYYDEGE